LADFYQSSQISLVLSWIFAVPTLLAFAVGGVALFNENTDTPIFVRLWVGFCVFFLTPFRYIMLQLLFAECYFFQSFGAVFSSMLVALYMPIVFGILWFIGLGLPILLLYPLVKNSVKFGIREIIAMVLLPVTCLLATLLFSIALPIAAKTVHWLDGRDVIRATNGPTQFFYDFVTSRLYLHDLPPYFYDTPMKSRDALRAHVATVYLDDYDHIEFIQKSYPEIFESLKQQGTIIHLEPSEPST
jgi:hypothetical protein